MKAFAVVFALVLVAPVRAAETDLLFPDGDKSARLRLEVTDEKAPEVAWTAFLNKLFAHFDRDADGALSEAEAKRVFGLPGGPTIVPDFAAMDTDRNGKVAPVEFRAFYRARGFTPVTIVVQQADALALGDALFRHLDRDADGKLSAAELKQAVALLKRLDEDEDETLSEAELFGGKNSPWAKGAGVGLTANTGEPAAVLKLPLGGKPALENGGTSFQLAAARLRVPGGTCSVVFTKDDDTTTFREARAFFAAQFKSATGDKPAAKARFEDPALGVLAGLFDAADRDGDGKLTRAELDTYFDLVELGLTCRVFVIVAVRGFNLFDLFDENSDGRLDHDELTRAAKNLPDQLARDKPLERDAVPASYRLTVSRKQFDRMFGLVPYGMMERPKPPAPRAARGPKWFLALDKNGDGFVSAREFVGSPELFAELDTNADGRISAEEAEAAKP